MITMKKLAELIDYALLRPDATEEDVVKHCNDAKKYNFASVCVNPAYVSLAAELLEDSKVKVCAVIGFPLGATTPKVKAFEAEEAVRNGADELDMVINIGALKSGNYKLVKTDIESVVKVAKLVKVIIETGLLTDEEKIKACKIIKEAGADFVKTSTGFGPGKATVEDIRIIRKTVGDLGIKASGSISSFEDAVAMVKAGADRIGTSRIEIVKGGKDGLVRKSN